MGSRTLKRSRSVEQFDAFFWTALGAGSTLPILRCFSEQLTGPAFSPHADIGAKPLVVSVECLPGISSQREQVEAGEGDCTPAGSKAGATLGSMPPNVPKVGIEKPPLPTLWVDTSVIIKITKVERGEALQDVEVQRCKRLRDLVRGLVRDGKLLFPESDQEEEYVAQRLDDDVHRMFASLSLGISMTHRVGIQDSHIFHGMKAYAKGLAAIYLPYSTYFHGDPVRQLEEVRHERFFVSLGLSKGTEMLRRRADAKADIGRKWEELRQRLVAERQTYEKQLELELHGYWDALVELVKKFYANMAAGRHDVWDFMGAHGAFLYRTYWRELGGQPPDWEGVYKFFCSTYFSELPLPFVSCRLNANLLTGNEAIAPGDPMDVELLSVALPVAHFVLADRRMELRIKQLGLDQKCNTEVYSMSTIDGLFARLEGLK